MSLREKSQPYLFLLIKQSGLTSRAKNVYLLFIKNSTKPDVTVKALHITSPEIKLSKIIS